MRALAFALVLFGGAALGKDRTSTARAEATPRIEALFKLAKVGYPPAQLYYRVFKKENEVELWAGNEGRELSLIKKYAICYASGGLGPKREEGDLQVPEGFYVFDEFNDKSNYHLALRVSYPNASDRVLGTPGKLGGLIYMHGNCVSIGCIAMED